MIEHPISLLSYGPETPNKQSMFQSDCISRVLAIAIIMKKVIDVKMGS